MCETSERLFLSVVSFHVILFLLEEGRHVIKSRSSRQPKRVIFNHVPHCISSYYTSFSHSLSLPRFLSLSLIRSTVKDWASPSSATILSLLDGTVFRSLSLALCTLSYMHPCRDCIRKALHRKCTVSKPFYGFLDHIFVALVVQPSRGIKTFK